MIGRGALGRPWVFSETLEALPPEAQREWKLGVIRRHLALIREHFREKYALIQTKKHLAWYTEGLGHATDCRRLIFQTASPEEAWSVFMRFWDARPVIDPDAAVPLAPSR
jgi:tRNA-dihydrouridine synthase B